MWIHARSRCCLGECFFHWSLDVTYKILMCLFTFMSACLTVHTPQINRTKTSKKSLTGFWCSNRILGLPFGTCLYLVTTTAPFTHKCLTLHVVQCWTKDDIAVFSKTLKLDSRKEFYSGKRYHVVSTSNQISSPSHS